MGCVSLPQGDHQIMWPIKERLQGLMITLTSRFQSLFILSKYGKMWIRVAIQLTKKLPQNPPRNLSNSWSWYYKKEPFQNWLSVGLWVGFFSLESAPMIRYIFICPIPTFSVAQHSVALFGDHPRDWTLRDHEAVVASLAVLPRQRAPDARLALREVQRAGIQQLVDAAGITVWLLGPLQFGSFSLVWFSGKD